MMMLGEDIRPVWLPAGPAGEVLPPGPLQDGDGHGLDPRHRPRHPPQPLHMRLRPSGHRLVRGAQGQPGHREGGLQVTRAVIIELQKKVPEDYAPTRAFSWLKAPSALTFKTLSVVGPFNQEGPSL